MSYCEKCQRILADDEKYCVVCGEPILEEKEEEILQELPPAIPSVAPPTVDDNPLIDHENHISEKYYDVAEEPISLFKKIALIALSVFIAPAGLITGLIMMAATETNKKDFGQTMVIISVAVFVAITVCCCGLTVLATLIYSA